MVRVRPVYALPTHRDLDHPVQLAQGAGVRHQQAAPHHRADPEQPHLDLDNADRVRDGRCGIGISAGFRLLRRSRHQPTISRPPLLRRGHHTLPHGPHLGNHNLVELLDLFFGQPFRSGTQD